MPSVRELTALYENVMLGPRRGPGVCATCFNFTAGYARCYACDHGRLVLDAVAPISYSVAREQLHHALASYKRLDGDVARRLGASLAAILWRFLAGHERCLADAVGTDRFDVVTTVPSGDRVRDERHPLRWIVGELVGPTRDRHERLLRRSDVEVPQRSFSAEKFVATGLLSVATACARSKNGCTDQLRLHRNPTDPSCGRASTSGRARALSGSTVVAGCATTLIAASSIEITPVSALIIRASPSRTGLGHRKVPWPDAMSG